MPVRLFGRLYDRVCGDRLTPGSYLLTVSTGRSNWNEDTPVRSEVTNVTTSGCRELGGDLAALVDAAVAQIEFDAANRLYGLVNGRTASCP